MGNGYFHTLPYSCVVKPTTKNSDVVIIFEPLSPRMPKRDSDCFIRRVSIVFSQSFKRGVSVTEIANDYVTLIHNY